MAAWAGRSVGVDFRPKRLTPSHKWATEQGAVFGSDTAAVQGTSFATPLVSGIVALMLEANPNLGFRDIQEILALSARKVADTATVWQNNNASGWNGGAMHVSHDYGFGAVDALAAVRLAETWTKVSTVGNEITMSYKVSLMDGTEVYNSKQSGKRTFKVGLARK